METAPPESIRVSIFHQTYFLRSREGEAHIRHVAQVVDERMQMVASQLATHDVAKVAVLAALNIAAEMEFLRDRYENDARRESLPPPAGDEAEAEDAAAQSAREAVREEASAQRSWFDDIFGAGETPKSEGERLSSRVKAKLHTHRRAERESFAIESGEDEE